jgi:hypothetical protein
MLIIDRIQITEPARFQCLTSLEYEASDLRKCGSLIELDALTGQTYDT